MEWCHEDFQKQNRFLPCSVKEKTDGMWKLDSDKKETEEPVEVVVTAYVLCFAFSYVGLIGLYYWLQMQNGIDRVHMKFERLFYVLKEYGRIVVRLASNGIVTYCMYILLKGADGVLKSEMGRIRDSKSYVTPLEGIVWVLSCTFQFALDMIEAESLFGDLSVSMCPADKPIPYIEAIEGFLATVFMLCVVYVLGGLWFEQARVTQDLEERRERRERNEMEDIVGESPYRSGRAQTMDPRDEINWFVFENKVCKCDTLGHKKEVNPFFLKCKNNQEFFSSMIQKYNEKTCPICLEGMFIDKMEETDLYMTECGHKFHYDCFENYYCSFNGYKTKFRIPCPVCRKFGEGCKLLDLGNMNKNHSNNNEPRHCLDREAI